MRYRYLASAACVLGPLAASAQDHNHAGPAVSPRAAEQVRDVVKMAERLSVTDSARAAGFVPLMGWVPFMGTHWVHGVRMLMGRSSNPLEPSQLMFSPMNGKETLVGAAYAYFSPLADSTRPGIFDGNPPWHDHPDLAISGTSLVMLHVWFVPSPDGPFAGMNPFLPYWALGLPAPPMDQMEDSAVNVRVRKAGLALAEVADTNGNVRLVRLTPETRTVLVERRARVRELIPEIERSARAPDWKRWNDVLERAAAEWDVMKEAYLKSVVHPDAKAALRRRLEQIENPARAGAHSH